MREIDLDEPQTVTMPIFTFLNYGDTRTGKTAFSGTFPRPLVLADATEKGYETLRSANWNDEATPRFESNVPPIVWTMETEADFAQSIERAQPLIASGRVKTLVVSSISFLADLVLNSILMRQQKVDMRRAYGDLGIQLRNMRIKAHGLGINVVWEALARHPDDDHPVGGPMIPGQQAEKFAAGVDFIFHTRINRTQPTAAPTFEVRTKPYVKMIGGNRLGARSSLLPDPMTNNYSAFLEHLGYDLDAIRGSLVPMDRIPKARPVAAPVAPPVVAAKPVAVTSIARPVARPVATTKPITNGKPATTGR